MLQQCVVGRTHTPEPVDQLELLVHVHHEDEKEDHGEDHLTDGDSRVSAVMRRSVADDDDETDELKERNEAINGQIWIQG